MERKLIRKFDSLNEQINLLTYCVHNKIAIKSYGGNILNPFKQSKMVVKITKIVSDSLKIIKDDIDVDRLVNKISRNESVRTSTTRNNSEGSESEIKGESWYMKDRDTHNLKYAFAFLYRVCCAFSYYLRPEISWGNNLIRPISHMYDECISLKVKYQDELDRYGINLEINEDIMDYFHFRNISRRLINKGKMILRLQHKIDDKYQETLDIINKNRVEEGNLIDLGSSSSPSENNRTVWNHMTKKKVKPIKNGSNEIELFPDSQPPSVKPRRLMGHTRRKHAKIIKSTVLGRPKTKNKKNQKNKKKTRKNK